MAAILGGARAADWQGVRRGDSGRRRGRGWPERWACGAWRVSDSVLGTEGDKGKSGGRGRGGEMKAPAMCGLAGGRYGAVCLRDFGRHCCSPPMLLAFNKLGLAVGFRGIGYPTETSVKAGSYTVCQLVASNCANVFNMLSL